MTINNRNCKVDFMTNRIIVSRKFLENSQKVYSEEFRTMIELQKIVTVSFTLPCAVSASLISPASRLMKSRAPRITSRKR